MLGEVPMTHALAALALAPFVGSFLGVLVKRLPAGEPVAWARSRCGLCGTQLGVRDLVPLASWLAGRGRCRHCGRPVGFFYPAIELGALAVAAWAAAVVPGWLIWPSCVLGWMLLALALIDARSFLLPDRLTIPLAAAGLVVAWWMAPDALWMHMGAVAVAYLVFAGVAAAYRRLRGREALGGGDAKLLAAGGAWVSLPGLPSIVLIAALAALVWAVLVMRWKAPVSGSTALPFGPFLAVATWVVWLHGPLALTLPSI